LGPSARPLPVVMLSGPIFESGSVFQPLFRSCRRSGVRPVLEALAYIGARGLREECGPGAVGRPKKAISARVSGGNRSETGVPKSSGLARQDKRVWHC